MAEISTSPSQPPHQSWFSTPNKNRAMSNRPYDCPSVFRKGMEYFVVHALCVIAINGTIVLAINYFKEKEVIPLKMSLLASGISAGTHHLLLDGRACFEKRDIRREVPFMGMEKYFAIAASILTTPFLTYGCANYLMKAQIKVLPTIAFSVTGAVTLFFAEFFK